MYSTWDERYIDNIDIKVTIVIAIVDFIYRYFYMCLFTHACSVLINAHVYYMESESSTESKNSSSPLENFKPLPGGKTEQGMKIFWFQHKTSTQNIRVPIIKHTFLPHGSIN